jgi:hypothetical protein
MTASPLRLLTSLLLLTIVGPGAWAQSSPHKGKKKTAHSTPAPSSPAPPEAILAKFQRVRMPYRATHLSARQRRMVQKLVEASQYLEDIFWRQSDPDGLTLLQSLAGSKDPHDVALHRLLMIFGSRYNLLDDNRPFAGAESMPPGRGLYPRGLTRGQIEQYVKDHPEKRAEIYSPTTVVRRDGDELVGVPYHVAYRSFLEPAAQALREAAALSDDAGFAAFLRARAKALLSDDYYARSRTRCPWRRRTGPRCAATPPPWRSWTPPSAPATCATATRRWPTICPTIPASMRRRAPRRSSSRTSWMRA